jgi:CheY-like chemotaxis protein
MPFKHAARCKLLLVEDSPDLLRMLETMLKSEGYLVQTATNRQDALEHIAAESFHIAVIDARLSDSDPDDYDGFQLMRELRWADPSTGIILLTTASDLDIVREALYSVSGEMNPTFEVSRTAASAFLEKTPQALRWLPICIQRVYNEVVRINTLLQIDDVEQLMFQLPRKLRFSDTPGVVRLQEELDDLMRKLFSEWQQVEIRSVVEQNAGYSKSFVFHATSNYYDGERPVMIAKIGECSMIEQEVERYRQYLAPWSYGSRHPASLRAVRRTRTLGGMIYTFDGLRGGVRDFAQFFQNTQDRTLVGDVISNLFLNTLTFEHTSKRVLRENVDLRAVYQPLLRLDPDELQNKLDELLVIARSVGKSSLSEKFWLNTDAPLPDPVEYALSGDFTGSYVETTIHGDLHMHTVLVDDCNDTWLIDFANTGRGPLLQDYIAFEAALLIESNELKSGRTQFEWGRALFGQPGELFPRLPNKLAGVPEVAKLHHAVLTVRRLAYHEMKGDQARMYLIGLFFTALRLMSVKFLTPPKRFHALTIAALIAENLEALEQGGA